MTKPFQAGHAAESGLLSAELISLGGRRRSKFWKRSAGSSMLSEERVIQKRLWDRPGQTVDVHSPGISLNLTPSGSLSHPAMTELGRLIEVNKLQAAQVGKARRRANHQMTSALLGTIDPDSIFRQARSRHKGRPALMRTCSIRLADDEADVI